MSFGNLFFSIPCSYSLDFRAFSINFCTKKMKQNKFQLSPVLSISFGHMIHDTYSSFLAPIIPLLVEKLGITYAVAGILYAIQRAPSMLNPLVGLVADKISLRYFIIVGPAVTSIAMSLLGVAPNLTAIIILLLITGISSTIFHVPSPVMIKEVAGPKTGLGMSFYMLGGELARTIGPLLILGGVSLWGLEGTYRLIPLGLAASALLYFQIRKIKISDKFDSSIKKEKPHHTLKKYLPLFMFIGLYSIFLAVMKSALTIFLPSYIKASGGSIWMGGISLSVLQSAGAVGTVMSGHFSDKLGRKRVLKIISLSMPILLMIFTFTKGLMMMPALILLGFVTFASNPVILAFVQDTNSDNPAFLNSIYMTMSFFISSLITLFIGFMGDMVGLALTYRICALAGLGLIPVTFFMPDLISKKSK